MALLYSQTATATTTAGTKTVNVASFDLSPVLAGMVIHFGARDRVSGDGYIIQEVQPAGANGGTLTLVGPAAGSFANTPFVIDTRDFNGSATNYALTMFVSVLNALMRLTSPLTNLFSGSRVLGLDKDTSASISRVVFSTAGRVWASIEQRINRQAETLALRAYPDGATPIDSFIMDLNSGGIDFSHTQVGIGSAETTDIGNVNAIGIVISGSSKIVSFGSAKNKFRSIVFANSGGTLSHNNNISLPGERDIAIRTGDRCIAISNSAGSWAVLSYSRYDGKAITPNSDVEVLGFTPVRQGGGPGQNNTNIIQIGHSPGGPKIAVDVTDFGKIWTDFQTGLSAQSNGYMKLPNGMILQWGNSVNQASDFGVLYPIEFPTVCLAVVISCNYNPNNGTITYTLTTDAISRTYFNVRARVINGASGPTQQGALPYCYLAIGY